MAPTTAARRSMPSWLSPVLAVGVLLAALETASRTGVVAASQFPPISEDLRVLFQQFSVHDFWTSVAHTIQGWAIGLTLASLLAVPFGILVGRLPLLHSSVRVVVEWLRPVPSVALVPLAILVFGIGLGSKVFLTSFAAFWPLFIQTLYGVRAVDPVASSTARSFGIKPMAKMIHVILPSAMPYIATGMRVASATALILTVTAELIIGSPGLGRDITIAQSGGSFTLMYALILVTGILGYMLNEVFAVVERRVLHWHPSHRVRGV